MEKRAKNRNVKERGKRPTEEKTGPIKCIAYGQKCYDFSSDQKSRGRIEVCWPKVNSIVVTGRIAIFNTHARKGRDEEMDMIIFHPH